MFNKYEVYSTTESVYCYKGTNVLINKLRIRNTEDLKSAENQITAIKQYAMLEAPIKGNFTKNHLFHIHKFMFGDIYYFAGKIRREQIAKGNTTFYPPSSINKELDRVFDYIKKNKKFHCYNENELFNGLAYVMAELNIIHPFREGNGRTIREFIRLLSLENNIQINWGNVDKDLLLEASIESVDNYKILINVLKQASSKSDII